MLLAFASLLVLTLPNQAYPLASAWATTLRISSAVVLLALFGAIAFKPSCLTAERSSWAVDCVIKRTRVIVETVLILSALAQWVMIGVLVAVVLVLAKHLGALQRRFPDPREKALHQGPGIGQQAPELHHPDVRTGALITRPPELPGLLMFVTTSCSTCAGVIPAWRSFLRANQNDLWSAVISADDELKTKEFLARTKLVSPTIASQELSDEFGVNVTPYVLYLDDEGVVQAGGVVNGLDELESVHEHGQAASRDSLPLAVSTPKREVTQ